jgi:hypothetical protein
LTIEDLAIGRGGKLNNLVVDVRPAVDGPSEVWGRVVSMPLAMRGCASIVDCILGGGEGKEKKSEFEPLPMMPSETLKRSVEESKKTWANIQKSAERVVEEGTSHGSQDETMVSESEAINIANSYATILKQCDNIKIQLKNCSNEAECQKAFMGMTVCAGSVMCPLQHKSFVEALEEVTAGKDLDEMTNAKINIAFETLGECVANNDRKASVARQRYPDVFERIVGK